MAPEREGSELWRVNERFLWDLCLVMIEVSRDREFIHELEEIGLRKAAELA
ncbi:hypothetical protein COLO4_19834 [Corchorus olitorius]|uniref:Uncharacterized protein n=1 Tax=Corchorus olitorius TaxID=93759 RepID=A0A1R3J359_9ROSI|nr:hypothetical protein COLO4_19834 [Corchorus olitorius]